MEIMQFLTIMATLLGGFSFMYKEMKGIEKDLKEDIKIQSARSDQLYSAFRESLLSQTKRSDQLYIMFIDLLKEKRG